MQLVWLLPLLSNVIELRNSLYTARDSKLRILALRKPRDRAIKSRSILINIQRLLIDPIAGAFSLPKPQFWNTSGII